MASSAMPSAALHRRWAREFLDHALRAPTRSRKLKYVRLAVNSSVRAQRIEAGDNSATAERPPFNKRWSNRALVGRWSNTFATISKTA